MTGDPYALDAPSPAPPFIHPNAAEMFAAEQIVDSRPVISAFAACEWDELDVDGQIWAAAIVREATRLAGGKAPRTVHVDMEAPIKWATRTFFRATPNHAAGIVLGFAPSFFAIGAELITGKTRGVALMIGPFWLGFAVSLLDEGQR
jgi:hypothetical protein